MLVGSSSVISQAAGRIRAKNPGRVPIICELDSKESLEGWMTKRSKFLVSEKLNVSQFRRFVRCNLVYKGEQEQPKKPPKVMLFLKGKAEEELVQDEMNVAELDRLHRSDDGFLYLMYSTKYSSKMDALISPEDEEEDEQVDEKANHDSSKSTSPPPPVSDEDDQEKPRQQRRGGETQPEKVQTKQEKEQEEQEEVKSELEKVQTIPEKAQEEQEKMQEEKPLETRDAEKQDDKEEQNSHQEEEEDCDDLNVENSQLEQQQQDSENSHMEQQQDGQDVENIQMEDQEKGPQVEEELREEEEELEDEDKQEQAQAQQRLQKQDEEHEQQEDTTSDCSEDVGPEKEEVLVDEQEPVHEEEHQEDEETESSEVSMKEEIPLDDDDEEDTKGGKIVECPATAADADELYHSPLFTSMKAASGPPSLNLEDGGASRNRGGFDSMVLSDDHSSSTDTILGTARAGWPSLSRESTTESEKTVMKKLHHIREEQLLKKREPDLDDWIEVDGTDEQQEEYSSLDKGRAFVLSTLAKLEPVNQKATELISSQAASLRDFLLKNSNIDSSGNHNHLSTSNIHSPFTREFGEGHRLHHDDREEEEEEDEWTCVNFDGVDESFGAKFL